MDWKGEYTKIKQFKSQIKEKHPEPSLIIGPKVRKVKPTSSSFVKVLSVDIFEDVSFDTLSCDKDTPVP
jgi:hypothetical protein